MRVAYICADPGIPVFGRKGASVHVREVVTALLARGCEVTLLARRFEGEPPAGLGGVRTVQLPPAGAKDPAERERLLLASNPAVRAAIESAGPFDLIYERHALWSFSPMELARDLGTTGILEVNAPLIQEQQAFRTLHDVPAAEGAAARAIGAADHIVAVSEGVAGHLRALRGDRNIHVIPNGVDTGRFSPLVAPVIPPTPGALTIGFVGTLKPWHGVDTLIEAFDRLHRADQHLHLLLVGDGPQRAVIEADVVARGLRHAATLTGAVDPALVPGLIRSMDIAVAPYPALPGFYFSPLKLFEYMASGVAIAAADAGQIAPILDHGAAGLLFRPGDAGSLTAAIGTLCGSPHLRAQLGAAARKAAVERHTWSAVARTILGLATGRAEMVA